MKIAVTYGDGNIFQHFGRTEYFKLYEVEDGQIISSEVISSNGAGHGALAGVLAGNRVDTLICGGIGAGAQNALRNAGIELCAGAEGNADDAVAAFLRGELKNSGANCNHHHEEGHNCGNQSQCCSGTQQQGKNTGKTLKVHYRGTFNDGTQFDSSYDRGEPLEFICGAGMMISGFDKAVENMEVGEVVEIHLMPEEAYGMPNPDNVLTIAVAQLPGAEELKVGDQVYLSGMGGQPVPVRVTELSDGNITLDANHEMAGKELNFRIELVSVQ